MRQRIKANPTVAGHGAVAGRVDERRTIVGTVRANKLQFLDVADPVRAGILVNLEKRNVNVCLT